MSYSRKQIQSLNQDHFISMDFFALVIHLMTISPEKMRMNPTTNSTNRFVSHRSDWPYGISSMIWSFGELLVLHVFCDWLLIFIVERFSVTVAQKRFVRILQKKGNILYIVFYLIYHLHSNRYCFKYWINFCYLFYRFNCFFLSWFQLQSIWNHFHCSSNSHSNQCAFWQIALFSDLPELVTIRQSLMNCAHNGNTVHRKSIFQAFNTNKYADWTAV